MNIVDWDFSGTEQEHLNCKNVETLKERHWKNGYREGLSSGQEEILQKGFNAGFSKAANAYFSLGKLKGISSALALICLQENTEEHQNVLKDTEKIFSVISSVQSRDPVIELPSTLNASPVFDNQHQNSGSGELASATDLDNLQDIISHLELNGTAESKCARNTTVHNAKNPLPNHNCSCMENPLECENAQDVNILPSNRKYSSKNMPVLYNHETDKSIPGSVEIPCDMNDLQSRCNTLLSRTGFDVC